MKKQEKASRWKRALEKEKKSVGDAITHMSICIRDETNVWIYRTPIKLEVRNSYLILDSGVALIIVSTLFRMHESVVMVLCHLFWSNCIYYFIYIIYSSELVDMVYFNFLSFWNYILLVYFLIKWIIELCNRDFV